MIVLMYHRRFIAPIRSGVKRHTIRRNRKRPIPIGAELSHRCWTEKAYRSPQQEIAGGVCSAVFAIYVQGDGVMFGRVGTPLLDCTIINKPGELDLFAVSDGFENWDDMMAYYREQKIKLPFGGVMIEWEAA